MLSWVMACTREVMEANTVIIDAPAKNIMMQERITDVERANTNVAKPSMISISSAVRPWFFVLAIPATISAPQMEPTPEQHSRAVKVPELPCSTSLANTGKKVMSGIAIMVIRKDSRIRGFIPSCTRMKAMPCFMLTSIDSLDLAGVKPALIMYSEIMTAMNEIPFRPKHQSGPSLTSAMPPRAGPMTRPTLNWMEFSAMALGRFSLGTREGMSAEYAGPPKLWAEPTMNDKTRMCQTLSTCRKVSAASVSAVVICTY